MKAEDIKLTPDMFARAGGAARRARPRRRRARARRTTSAREARAGARRWCRRPRRPTSSPTPSCAGTTKSPSGWTSSRRWRSNTTSSTGCSAGAGGGQADDVRGADGPARGLAEPAEAPPGRAALSSCAAIEPDRLTCGRCASHLDAMAAREPRACRTASRIHSTNGTQHGMTPTGSGPGPDGHRAERTRRARVRHLLAAAEGADRLPGRPGQRRRPPT